jgi:dipeptidyl aminopeptidase/acylaminoacyl peptidase
LNITQEGNNLTVVRTQTNRSGDEMTVTLKYTLDGKECDNSNERGTSKSVVSWSEGGKDLTITTNRTSERDGQKFETKSVEIWKLGDGGKTITIDQTVNSPRGERKNNLVYDKK